MKRPRLAAIAAFCASGLVTLWARAIGAPTDQYGPFNKADTTIRDLKTGLTWLREASAVKDHRDAGATYCATAPGGPFRLPTYKELLTLVDEDPHWEYDPGTGTTTLRYIDPNAFPATPPDLFWTISASPGGAKVVNFGDGTTAARNPGSTGDIAYARCVR